MYQPTMRLATGVKAEFGEVGSKDQIKSSASTFCIGVQSVNGDEVESPEINIVNSCKKSHE